MKESLQRLSPGHRKGLPEALVLEPAVFGICYDPLTLLLVVFCIALIMSLRYVRDATVRCMEA